MPNTPRLPRRTANARLRRGDMARATVVTTALAGLFAAAYAIGTSWDTLRKTAVASAQSQQSDDDLTTGSIVFVPVLGNTCRQNLIDNRTWEVRDNGTAPCNEVLGARPYRRSGAPTSRLDIIRESFRKSP
jgi:hypothetical protein